MHLSTPVYQFTNNYSNNKVIPQRKLLQSIYSFSLPEISFSVRGSAQKTFLDKPNQLNEYQ